MYASLSTQGCSSSINVFSFHILSFLLKFSSSTFICCSETFPVIIILYPLGLIKYWCAHCLPLAFAIFFIQTVSTFIIHEIKLWYSSNGNNLCFTSCFFWKFQGVIDLRRSLQSNTFSYFRLKLSVFRNNKMNLN